MACIAHPVFVCSSPCVDRLRVLVEENMVEEGTLRELRARYAAMLKQGKGLVHGSGRVDAEGVPTVIDAEVVFCLLVQQGRVVDGGAGGGGGGAANAARMAGLAKLERTMTESSAVLSLQRMPSRRIEMLRAESAGMGRGATRGMMLDKAGDVVTAVDVTTQRDSNPPRRLTPHPSSFPACRTLIVRSSPPRVDRCRRLTAASRSGTKSTGCRSCANADWR